MSLPCCYVNIWRLNSPPLLLRRFTAQARPMIIIRFWRFSASPSLGLLGNEGGRALSLLHLSNGVGKNFRFTAARNLSRSQGRGRGRQTANLSDWVMRGDMDRNNSPPSCLATFSALFKLAGNYTLILNDINGTQQIFK